MATLFQSSVRLADAQLKSVDVIPVKVLMSDVECDQFLKARLRVNACRAQVTGYAICKSREIEEHGGVPVGSCSSPFSARIVIRTNARTENKPLRVMTWDFSKARCKFYYNKISGLVLKLSPEHPAGHLQIIFVYLALCAVQVRRLFAPLGGWRNERAAFAVRGM